MFKRIGFFLLTNILVVLTIQIVVFLISYLFGVDVAALAGGNGVLIITSAVWGMGGAFISLMLSKTMAKSMMGVEIVDETSGHRDIVELVHRFAKQSGLPKMPEVGIYHSPEINAFATGPSKSNSLVAVSTGLLENMDRDEIEGVIAHEVAHISNGDMVTMTLIQGIVNAFVIFFSRLLANFILRGDDEDGESSGAGFFQYMALTLFLEFVFAILGTIVVAYFSRIREYRADAGGASLAGRDKMTKALRRLKLNFEGQTEHAATENRGEAIQTLKISNKAFGLFKLFSTHPDLDDRIKALEMR